MLHINLQSVYKVFFFAISILLSMSVWSAQTITLTDTTQNISISKQIQFFADSSHEYQLADILRDEQRGKNNWQTANSFIPNYGFTESAYWVRINIDNKSNQKDWIVYLEYLLMDYIELYVPE